MIAPRVSTRINTDDADDGVGEDDEEDDDDYDDDDDRVWLCGHGFSALGSGVRKGLLSFPALPAVASVSDRACPKLVLVAQIDFWNIECMRAPAL